MNGVVDPGGKGRPQEPAGRGKIVTVRGPRQHQDAVIGDMAKMRRFLTKARQAIPFACCQEERDINMPGRLLYFGEAGTNRIHSDSDWDRCSTRIVGLNDFTWDVICMEEGVQGFAGKTEIAPLVGDGLKGPGKEDLVCRLLLEKKKVVFVARD